MKHVALTFYRIYFITIQILSHFPHIEIIPSNHAVRPAQMTAQIRDYLPLLKRRSRRRERQALRKRRKT